MRTEATHRVTPGSIVCCRNRDWVLLPSNSPDVHLLRPLTGATDDIALLNPNTGNCPIFRTQADAELTKAIYRRVPIFAKDGGVASGWHPRIRRVFDMNKEDVLAQCHIGTSSPGAHWLPMFEAKMIYQFDHRWATYEERERRRTEEQETEARDVTPREKSNPTGSGLSTHRKRCTGHHRMP